MGFCKAKDLTCLHADAARQVAIGSPLKIQAFHEATAVSIPSAIHPVIEHALQQSLRSGLSFAGDAERKRP